MFYNQSLQTYLYFEYIFFLKMQKKQKKLKKNIPKKGKGIVNSLINKLPFEVHIPSYQYCGPGTKLAKRLKRNDPGINELDRACKAHDIAYSKSTDVVERNRADNILAEKAWDRFKSRDASFGERTAALGVSGIMKAKSKMGMGVQGMSVKHSRKRLQPKLHSKSKKCKSSKSGAGVRFRRNKVSIPSAFRLAVKNAKRKLQQHKPRSMSGATVLALKAAKAAIKPFNIPKHSVSNDMPRIIPVPKIGGVIPLIPVFAGLSALGALMGGSAGIASAAISANRAKKDLNELKRHNQRMEAISLGKQSMRAGGAGLYLKPYKKGLGLYLRPYSKNIH